MKKTEGTVYIRNENRHASGMYDQARHAQWQPEYDRLNVAPTEPAKIGEDFMYTKRYPIQVKTPPPLPKAPSQQLVQAEDARRGGRVNSGTDQDFQWNMAPPIAPSRDIGYDEIPNPPPTPYPHYEDEIASIAPLSPLAPVLEPEVQKVVVTPDAKFILNEISSGEYVVLVKGTFMYSSYTMDDIENYLNDLIFEKGQTSIEDIAVIRRLHIKIGASIV